MAEEDSLGALLRGLYPPVIEGYTPYQGQRILDRQNDKAIVPDPNEFQPFWKGAADFYGVPRSMTEGVAGPHTNNPLAKQLGYNDIRRPTSQEVDKFRQDVLALSPKRYGGEGDAEPERDDLIGQLLRHLGGIE